MNQENEYYRLKDPPFSTRLIHFLEDIWPSVYRIINDLFFGIINFLKDTISSIWRRD